MNKKNPEKKKRGRPKIEIDFNQFEKLCMINCTLSEIASFFCVSEDTIENRVKHHYKMLFSDVYKKHSGKGKAALRRLQFDLAKKNPGMAIWLGKQYLNQTEKNEISTEEVENRLKIIIDIIKNNVKDPDLLKKIADEIKTFKK